MESDRSPTKPSSWSKTPHDFEFVKLSGRFLFSYVNTHVLTISRRSRTRTTHPVPQGVSELEVFLRRHIPSSPIPLLSVAQIQHTWSVNHDHRTPSTPVDPDSQKDSRRLPPFPPGTSSFQKRRVPTLTFRLTCLRTGEVSTKSWRRSGLLSLSRDHGEDEEVGRKRLTGKGWDQWGSGHRCLERGHPEYRPKGNRYTEGTLVRKSSHSGCDRKVLREEWEWGVGWRTWTLPHPLSWTLPHTFFGLIYVPSYFSTFRNRPRITYLPSLWRSVDEDINRKKNRSERNLSDVRGTFDRHTGNVITIRECRTISRLTSLPRLVPTTTSTEVVTDDNCKEIVPFCHLGATRSLSTRRSPYVLRRDQRPYEDLLTPPHRR